jgi:hypothetical protein
MKTGIVLSDAAYRMLLLTIALSLSSVRADAAMNDVTGLTPTLTVTFDNDSVTNINGTGTVLIVSPEGTSKFVTSPNGRAIDTSSFTPYGNVSGITVANSPFTVSAFATLGTNANGILFHLRDDVGGTGGGLVLRRGASATDAVVTYNHSSTPVITASGILSADTAYHHYAIVATGIGLTLYVDGVVKGTSTSNTISAAKTNYQFGSRHTGTVSGETKGGGKLDDFRVYGAVLTQGQVQILYTALNGLISIKTGTRDDTENGGNVSLFGTNFGVVAAYPSTWNKTTNTLTGGAGVITNLLTGAGSLSGIKLYYTSATNAVSGGTTNTPNGTLTKTCLDDGSAATYTVNDSGTAVVLPDPGTSRGWEAMLTGVAYTNADLYVIIASDSDQNLFKACPVLVKVGDGAWTSYYGEAGLETTRIGNLTWPGSVYSTGVLKEGNHYLKIPLTGLTTNTPIAITHGARDLATQTRIGLAGLQLVRRDNASTAANDPYYLRTVTGSANWDESVWENKGTTANAWLNSSAEQKTTAILTTSGATSLTLPDGGVTAEAFSVKGSGAFTLAGPGALTLNGRGLIDSCGVAATDIVNISAAVLGTNITLTANNPNAATAGYTRLVNTTNDFDTLTVTRGTLAADSRLPADAALVLGGGSLLFTSSGTFTNALQFADDARISVAQTFAAGISATLTSAFNLTKSGNGTLTLSGGATSRNLLFENAGTLRLTGTTPFAFVTSIGSSNATALEVAAPLTLSGTFALGGSTLTLDEGGTITAPAIRWCDGGPYTTTANQSGGRIVVSGSANAVSTSDSVLMASYPGTLNYTQSGGEFLATNAVVLMTWQGAAAWTIGGSGRAYVKGVNMRGTNQVGSSTTLALSGGTLEVGGSGVFSTATTSARTINLSTGTVRAWDDFTVAASAVSSAVNLKDSASGVTLDSNGKTITWSAPLADAGKVVVNDSATTPGLVRLMAAGTHTGGTDLRSGTLEAGHASALGTGPLRLTGGTLSVGKVDATAGALTATNPATLKISLGLLPDLSDSGSLRPASVVFQGDATNALQVVLDLHGLDSTLAEYPILLSSSIPADATNKMTVSFINRGENLPQTAAVSLQSRAGGIYAVFTGVTVPKALFWRNGQASGDWSTNEAATPWGINAVGGTSAPFSAFDSVNFTDTDQSAVTVSVQGSLAPSLMKVNNAGTAYSFADAGDGSLTLPDTAFTKQGSGSVAFGVPVAMANSLTVEAGKLGFNAAFGTVSNATFASSLTVASNAILSFGGNSVTQTLSGSLSGTGTLSVASGKLKLSGSATSFGGNVIVSNGVLELARADQFLSNNSSIRVAAGAVCEVTARDATGYDVPNTNPIILYGTLKFLQRDSTGRGIRMYDGSELLLKGTDMDSTHAMDLFKLPIIALVSGAASIRPLDPANAAQASMLVRTEHSPKTFDVQASNAVLTVAAPFIGGDAVTALAKVGPGTLRWTAVNTTASKILVSAGTLEIGDPGRLGAGTSAQPIEIATNAVFRYDSSASQTLSGTITTSGSFVKSGAGKLTLSGTLTVNSGGALVVSAVTNSVDAVVVNGSAMTVNGTIQVLNAARLTGGKTYILLTSAQALPSGIASKVTVDQHSWIVETVNTGKTLQIHRLVGTLIQVR